MQKLMTIFLVVLSLIFGENVSAQEIKIGSQIWATKNLDVSFFRNGDPIPLAKTQAEWEAAGKSGKPAWCYYGGNADMGDKYGKLYNWFAVNDVRGIAPKGWHIPTDSEWTILTKYLGGEKSCGNKMKDSTGWSPYIGEITCPECSGWNDEYRAGHKCSKCNDTKKIRTSLSGNGSNSSGFSGLPGGSRGPSGSFYSEGSYGCWWSSSASSSTLSWFRDLFSNKLTIGKYDYEKVSGLSVRCIKN